MNKVVFIPFLSLLALSGCSSTKPLSWAEKELKYGPTCEKEGFEKGSPEYLCCVAETYQEEATSHGTNKANKNHTSSTGSAVMPWELHRDTENRVSHSYGRLEKGAPDVPVLDKSITW